MQQGIFYGQVFRDLEQVRKNLPAIHKVVVVGRTGAFTAYNKSMDPTNLTERELLKKNLAGARHLYGESALIVGHEQ